MSCRNVLENHKEYVLLFASRSHPNADQKPPELKETHLAPIANPFSRSSSTSTIVNSDTAPTTTQPPPLTTNAASDPKGIAASEAIVSAPPLPLKEGVLILTLHEGKGMRLSEQDEKVFTNVGDPNAASASARASSVSFAQGSSAFEAGSTSRPKTSGGAINSVPTNHGRYATKYLPYALVDFDKQQIFVDGVSGSPENPFWAGTSTQYKFDVSRTASMIVSVYIRNPYAPRSAGRSADLCIGSCLINPKYEVRVRSGERKEMQPSPVDWYSLQHSQTNEIMGTIKVGLDFVENRQQSLKIDDFDLLKVVGKGSFGKVMQVKKKDTGRIYALKTLRKAHIISRSEVSHTLAERSVLAQINNPFIVPLKFSFQSAEKLYLVLNFVNGGELFHHLQKEQRFNINRARFYAAELLCALECLHGFNVIYRDLKPENILLDYSGHIALCDFGLCKLDMKDEDTTNSKLHSVDHHSLYLTCPSFLWYPGISRSRTFTWRRIYKSRRLVDIRRSAL